MTKTLTKPQLRTLRTLAIGGSGIRIQKVLDIFSARTIHALVRKGYLTYGVDNQNFSTFVITPQGWSAM